MKAPGIGTAALDEWECEWEGRTELGAFALGTDEEEDEEGCGNEEATSCCEPDNWLLRRPPPPEAAATPVTLLIEVSELTEGKLLLFTNWLLLLLILDCWVWRIPVLLRLIVDDDDVGMVVLAVLALVKFDDDAVMLTDDEPIDCDCCCCCCCCCCMGDMLSLRRVNSLWKRRLTRANRDWAMMPSTSAYSSVTNWLSANQNGFWWMLEPEVDDDMVDEDDDDEVTMSRWGGAAGETASLDRKRLKHRSIM